MLMLGFAKVLNLTKPHFFTDKTPHLFGTENIDFFFPAQHETLPPKTRQNWRASNGKTTC